MPNSHQDAAVVRPCLSRPSPAAATRSPRPAHAAARGAVTLAAQGRVRASQVAPSHHEQSEHEGDRPIGVIPRVLQANTACILLMGTGCGDEAPLGAAASPLYFRILTIASDAMHPALEDRFDGDYEGQVLYSEDALEKRDRCSQKLGKRLCAATKCSERDKTCSSSLVGVKARTCMETIHG